MTSETKSKMAIRFAARSEFIGRFKELGVSIRCSNAGDSSDFRGNSHRGLRWAFIVKHLLDNLSP